MRLIKLLENILLEIIEIYPINDIEKKDIKFEIKRDDKNGLIVFFTVYDRTMEMQINKSVSPIQNSYSVFFGQSLSGGKDVDISTMFNDKYKYKTLMTVFSFLKYYIEKYNIDSINYDVSGGDRDRMYEYYMKKHFSEFKKEIVELPEEDDLKLVIWKKN